MKKVSLYVDDGEQFDLSGRLDSKGDRHSEVDGGD